MGNQIMLTSIYLGVAIFISKKRNLILNKHMHRELETKLKRNEITF